MKSKRFKIAVLSIVMLAERECCFPQGTFQNLDFESAIPGLNVGLVPIASALPGWTGYLGSNQTDLVVYNTISLGAAAITLQGPRSLEPILQGQYTVLLQPSTPGGLVIPALAQMGMVPTDALSIRFCSRFPIPVTFSGQQIPLYALETTSTCIMFGGDISAFAGQTGELRFRGAGFLDAIQFSNQPIPEPRGIVMLALGGLLFGWRLLCKRT